MLTFQKVNQADLLQASCVRAIDRNDFAGVFRLQLFHLEMAKCAADVQAAMPNANAVDEKGTWANIIAKLAILWFTNSKKKLVRCGNYERHAQLSTAIGLCQAMNMYTNYIKEKGINEGMVKTRAEVEELLCSMLDHFGASWIFDPKAEKPDEPMNCDLFLSSRDQVVRLVHTLAFAQCEHENDATGLRALRRLSVITFLSKSNKSKYALYLLMDLVIELSSSERTRKRMDQLVCVNPSGTKGGYLYR